MESEPQPNIALARLLLEVRRIRSRIPNWSRCLIAAATEAKDQTPDFEKLTGLLTEPGSTAPRESATELRRVAEELDASPDALVGDHAGMLEGALGEASKWWGDASDAIARSDGAGVRAGVESAAQALDAALQHALFLTFADDVRKGHVGESRRIDDYCSGWGLSAADVNQLWSWVLEDQLEFAGEELPIALDTVNRCAYRKTESGSLRLLTAITPLWGGAIVFGAVALLFELLYAAGLTAWPDKWVWKMAVLLLFVALGALAHIATSALSVNYNDPMKVYDAGGLLDWLSLRWIAVLRMYVPVVFVVAALWGAGNVPTSFQDLGTVLLAGYSADSAIRAALSKLSAQTGAQ